MDNQNGTVDRMVEQLTGAPEGSSATGADQSGGPAVSPLFGPPANGRESAAGQTDPSDEAPAASLVGSLSVFTLADILSMLASTSQTGELQVVSETVDGRVWLDGGELSDASVDGAATVGQVVFELACVTDGWFYFTTGLVSSNGQRTVPVAAVLTEVRSQVDEWRQIRDVVPLEAIVTLSIDPPGQDVQIRNDQWRVLTTVGTSGHSVKSVLDIIGEEQIVVLRTLRDLHAAGLIELAPEPGAPVTASADSSFGGPSTNESAITPLPTTTPMVLSEDSAPDELASAPPPSGLDSTAGTAGDRFDNLAEVAIMPPPIAGDPWAPMAESNGTDDDGVA